MRSEALSWKKCDEGKGADLGEKEVRSPLKKNNEKASEVYVPPNRRRLDMGQTGKGVSGTRQLLHWKGKQSMIRLRE